MKFGELNKTMILIVLFLVMGCTNSTSHEIERNITKVNSTGANNDILLYAENYKVKLKSCSLSIPSRYNLQNFSYQTPLYPINTKPYTEINFSYKEASTVKNFILSHSIHIANKKSLNIEVLTSKLQFISSKEVFNLKILRYKPKELRHIDKSNPQHIKNEKLYKLNNTIIVNKASFTILVDETDEYIDEIYKMIEGCANEINIKEKNEV